MKILCLLLKLNILFIVVDSLRPDRILGSEKSAITPNIDKLINSGTYFSNVTSSIPATKRATASLLTSLHPFNTSSTNDNFFKLKPTLKTHFSILKNNDYSVFGLVPELFSTTNLFSDVENKDLFYDNIFDRLHNRLDDRIINLVNSIKSKSPWVCYIHLLDLIHPVISHGKFDDKKYGKDHYDRIISNIDSFLGDLLKQISLSDTLVVLTADHGNYIPTLKTNNKIISAESTSLFKLTWKLDAIFPKRFRPISQKLYNYYKLKTSKKLSSEIETSQLTQYEQRIFENIIGHTRDIHDESIMIPLLMVGKNLPPTHFSDNIRQIDIFPTLFDFLDIKYKANFDGVSLFSSIQKNHFSPLVSYIENLPSKENSWQKIIAIRTQNYKFARSIDSRANIELYDLKNDPLEQNNISLKEPKLVSKFENILNSIVSINHQHKKNS